MQKLPVAIVLASLMVVVAVAKTQLNKATVAYPVFRSNYDEEAIKQDREGWERVNAAMARYGEAEKSARALLDKGQLVAAEAECRRALKLDVIFFVNGVPDPPQESGMRLLGDIQLAQGKYQEALKSYGVNNPHRMRQLHGGPEMCLKIAQCYVGLNDFERALKFYNYLIRRHPAWNKDLPGAGNLHSLEATLLMLRAGDGRSSEQALLRFRAAEKLAPTNWFISDTIGELLHDMDRYDEAVASYRRAMQLNIARVSYGHRLRVEMHDEWHKRNKQEAQEFQIGQYELKPQWKSPNGTFVVIEIKPGGRYSELIYWGIQWQNEKPNPKLGPRNLTYTIYPDGTHTQHWTGTYVVTGNDIDLTHDSGPNSDPRFDVKSCRVTRNGLVLLRQFSFRQMEDVDSGNLLHDSGAIEQLYVKIR